MSTFSDDGWGSPAPVPKEFKFPEKAAQDEPSYDKTNSFISDQSDDSIPIVESPSQTPLPTSNAEFSFDETRSDISNTKRSAVETNVQYKTPFGNPLPEKSENKSTKPLGFGSVEGKADNKSLEPSEFGNPVAEKLEKKSTKPTGFGRNELPEEFKNSFIEKLDTKSTKPYAFGNNAIEKASNKPVGFGKTEVPREFGNSVVEKSENKSSKPSGFGTNKVPTGFGTNKVPTGFGSVGTDKPSGFGYEKTTEQSNEVLKNEETSFANQAPKSNRFGKQSSFGSESTQQTDNANFGKTETTKSSAFGSNKRSEFGDVVKVQGSSRVGADFQPPCSSAQKSDTFGQAERSSKPLAFGNTFGGKPVGFVSGSSSQSGNKTVDSRQSSQFGADFTEPNSKPTNTGRNEIQFAQAPLKQQQHHKSSDDLSDDGWSELDSQSVSHKEASTEQANTFGNDAMKFSQQQPTSKQNEWSKEDSVQTIQAEESSFVATRPRKEVRFGDSEGGFGSRSDGFSKQNNGAQLSVGFGSSSTNPTSSNNQRNQSGFGRQNDEGFGTRSSGGFGSGQVSRSTTNEHRNEGFGTRTQSRSNDTIETSGFGTSQANRSSFGQQNDTGFGTRSSSAFAASDGFGVSDSGFGGDGSTNDRERARVCYNCKEDGHTSRDCPQPQKVRTCNNCGEEGHMSRECPQPQKPMTCRNCGEEGHMSRECQQPRKPSGICYNCQQEGHSAKECENERVIVEPTEPCPRCKSEGHWSRDCPTRPRDLEGNLLVPHEFESKSEESLFEKVVPKVQWWNEADQDIVISMATDVKIPDLRSFDEFAQLDKTVLQNLKKMRLEKPMPVQRAVFLPIINGADIVACAHTGCGKTLAFLLPLVTRIMQSSYSSDGEDEVPSPRLLIISPTRELALQTYQVVQMLTYQTDISKCIVYGGTSRSGNLQQLMRNRKLGILVGTMGRLKDYINAEQIALNKLEYVVLDEADRMVDATDFGEEVVELFGNPNNRKAQMVLFSASFKDDLQKSDLINVVKSDYAMITVNEFGTANTNIRQNILQVERTSKKEKLLEILGIDSNYCLMPDARVTKEKTLIFVNSVKFADVLACSLKSSEIAAIPMHSYQNQQQRESVMDDFVSGAYTVMVASNVCARGLDISGLHHVINYDMPTADGFDEYVNRIGRTGRAGFHGESTAFLDPQVDTEIIHPLVSVLEKAGKPVPDWLMDLKKCASVEKAIADETEEW